MLVVLFVKIMLVPCYYHKDISATSFRQNKGSDVCTIICPGLGLHDILTNRFSYTPEKYGDVIALSYASMLDIPIKYLWIELWDEFYDHKEDYNPNNFLPEAYMCLLSHIFHRYNHLVAEDKNYSVYSLLTPKIGLPIIPKSLNPTYLAYIGGSWPTFDAAKAIVNEYLVKPEFMQYILNLRGSLLRCISFAITQSYEQINIIGVEPEKSKYFFEEDLGLQLIPKDLYNSTKSYLHDISHQVGMISNKDNIHPTEISHKPSLAKCTSYFLNSLLRTGISLPIINYIGDSPIWNNVIPKYKII